MRSISIQEFEQDPKACIAEAEAGQRLVLVRGGKAIAEIVPGADSAFTSGPVQAWNNEEERLAAGEELLKILRKGFDLGGLKMMNRDELYDRD